MRGTIRRLVQRLHGAGAFNEPVYEFGAYEVAGQPGRSIRGLFDGQEFIGADFRPGPGVDRVLDLESLDLPDNSVGSAICLDTFEHVKRFWVAIEEIHRILKPGGVALITSVMYFPIHDFPADYWRFTPAGFEAAAGSFDQVFVEWAGLRDFPHTVVLLAVKGTPDEAVARSLEQALAAWKRSDAQGWKELMSVILPPLLLLPLYRIFTRLTGGNNSS